MINNILLKFKLHRLSDAKNHKDDAFTSKIGSTFLLGITPARLLSHGKTNTMAKI